MGFRRRTLTALKTRWFSVRFMGLAGAFAAAVIFVCCNVLVSRFYTRWDATTAGHYSLSAATVEVMEELNSPIEVVVFLGQGDPLTSSVRYTLDAYGAHTTQLSVKFVDPDRNPAEFVALQQEYGIFEGRTDNGRLATEASIAIVRGQKRWFITTDDIVAYDENEGQARPRLEQVLTEGIVNVLGRDKPRLCFSRGHRELSLQSGGPQGLGEFRRRLEQNNYQVSEVDLSIADPEQRLSGCRLVIVAGPTVPFAAGAVARLVARVQAGTSLLLSVGPVVDDSGGIIDPNLGGLTHLLGASFKNNLVFELDDSLSMPVGLGGEVFLSTPLPHAVTAGLVAGEEPRYRVLVQLSQAIHLSAEGQHVQTKPLLTSSPKSVSFGDFGVLTQSNALDQAAAPAAQALAVAAEFVEFTPPGQTNGARVALIGTSSLLWSSTWTEPSLTGTRRFMESLVSWLAAQPRLVSVPEKPPQAAGLHLTTESLSEVQRYVLLYMPLCVALLGALVLYRRRREDQPESPSEAA